MFALVRQFQELDNVPTAAAAALMVGGKPGT
jgi:hypothetical protein